MRKERRPGEGMSGSDDNRIDREQEEAVFATIVNRVVRMDEGAREKGSGEEATERAESAHDGTEKAESGKVVRENESTADEQIMGESEGIVPGRAMDQRCLKTIRGHFAGRRAKRLAKASLRYVAGAAAVLALFCLCVGVIFPNSTEATDPIVRESILDFISDRTEHRIDYTYLYYEGSDNQLLSVETGWLPEDLELLSCSVTGNTIELDFGETENGLAEGSLSICVYGSALNAILGTEYEEVTVQGNIALLIENTDTDDAESSETGAETEAAESRETGAGTEAAESATVPDIGTEKTEEYSEEDEMTAAEDRRIENRISLIWYDPKSGFMIWIWAYDMEREDVLHLAEELTINWEQGDWTVKDTTGFGSMDGY